MFDFSGLKVLVLGEAGLDVYAEGVSNRLSPEAPVPVVNDVVYSEYPGMSANLANNLAQLGADVRLVTILGCDDAADKIVRLSPFDVTSITDPSRPTTTKTRVLCNAVPLARLDVESRESVGMRIQQGYWEIVQRLLNQYDGVFIQDYGKGLWSRTLLQDVIRVARFAACSVFVDPNQGRDVSDYTGATILKPNFKEGYALAETSFPTTPVDVARQLQKVVGGTVVLTAPGQSWTASPGHESTCQAPQVEVVDVAGAGDTFLAVLGLLRLAKVEALSWNRQTAIAHQAASLVVQKRHVAPITIEELNQLPEVG